tara:strand:+ start:1841 stop:2239 length:399 start_codon:yes stop_codon:yes gene_type:complete
MIKVIAEFIRDDYSHYGVEVGAIGKRSLTLKLPEDLPLTELVGDVWNKFGATAELRYSHSESGASMVIVLGGILDDCGRAESSGSTRTPYYGLDYISILVCLLLILFGVDIVASATTFVAYARTLIAAWGPI